MEKHRIVLFVAALVTGGLLEKREIWLRRASR